MDVATAIVVPLLMGLAVVAACLIENLPNPRPRP
jgi:hypothetical protein